MHTKRIFWQIYPGLLTATLLALVLFFGLFTVALNRFYERQVAEHLESLAAFAVEQVGEQFSSDQLAALNALTTRLGTRSPARVTLILPDGTVAGESDKSPELMDNHLNRPEIQEAIQTGKPAQTIRFSDSVEKRMLYVAVPVYRDGTFIGVVRTAMPLVQMNETLRGVERSLAAGGLLVLLLVAAVSWLISRRIVRPIEQIRLGAERFAQGDFSQKLPATGSTETGSLAETMNQMAAQLEERLRTVSEERNQREAVLSSMVEGVLAVDTTGHIISLNKAAAQFFHVFQPGTAPGRSLEEVFRNVRLQRFVADVLAARETLECELTVRNNNTYYLQARGTNLLGRQGERIGAVVVFNDVSRLRRLENLRREFVANVSHELKTPITSIKGFVETLRDGALNDPDEAERFLGIIARHADRLNAIIEDLLALSHLEQDGREGVEMQPTPLREVLTSAVEVCAHRASEKNIAVRVECPDGLEAVINPPLIEQALINLIGNAVKYSAGDKTVTLSARTEEGEILLDVADQGCGIAPEHLDRLFERFYRIDKGRSRQEGGTGLGLAIVKHIAQAHGGSVSVRSVSGKGSVFTVHLRAAAAT
jgi:two-component system, OmpR family, phosphate regulon sensor histidine kinase PhoR